MNNTITSAAMGLGKIAPAALAAGLLAAVLLGGTGARAFRFTAARAPHAPASCAAVRG